MVQLFNRTPALLLIMVLWSWETLFLIPILTCCSMAGRKGKSRALWVVLSLFFGWIAVLFLAIASPED